MERIRFSLSRLVYFIAFSGLVLAGLRSGSNDWFKSIYTITFGVLVYAAIAARYRGAFWYGFAVAGWLYFLIGFGPWIGSSSGPGAVNRDLVTSIIEEVVTAMLPSAGPPTQRNAQAFMMIRDLQQANRNGICHSALTIVIAIIGGQVARVVESRGKRGSQGPGI